MIGSNTEIAVYNLLEEKYNNIPMDNFPHCVSFNDTFQEIFYKKIGEEDVLISQNGYPCYDLVTLSQSVTLKSFNEKFFLRIVSSKREKPIYTLKLPDLKLKNLYERSRLVITYNAKRTLPAFTEEDKNPGEVITNATFFSGIESLINLDKSSIKRSVYS